MRISIPVWNSCVSPVLDTARHLLIVDIQENCIVSRRTVAFDGGTPEKNAGIIAGHADILICGALSWFMFSCLASHGVTVYPWVMGEVDRILDVFLQGKEPGGEFSMPGCRRNRRRWRCGVRRFSNDGTGYIQGKDPIIKQERKGWEQ